MSELTQFEQYAIFAVLVVAILGLGYAVFLRNQILREDKGTARMQEILGWIKSMPPVYSFRK